ncbi:MAG: ubiquinol-cytochrome C chaperone [Sphingomonas sp. 28-62-20]|uniref:ubiquinol-cytochrome C chaperone family protein n=1 Tax=Sphingomonas sp. 28-62-20 TaxID=1970433 RepID=UPI000BDC428E|nr:MAG: ubiquinol-cytochrome C chaperone [Sphingomonas sp. 28-62-20]
MGLIDRLFGRSGAGAASAPLYTAIVARGRAPDWYLAGGVADTIDGRFDMIAAILSFVLLRMEEEPAAAMPSVELTERFIEDMDSQLREEGVGDVGIGKRVGHMVSMLGGRLGAYRAGLAEGDLSTALRRNLYRGGSPDPAQLDHVAGRLMDFRRALAATPVAALLAGDLP